MIVADGFSCRQQIGHATGRWALHPAEVLALAARGEAEAAGGNAYREPPARLNRQKAAAAAGLAAAAGCLLYFGVRRLSAGR